MVELVHAFLTTFVAGTQDATVIASVVVGAECLVAEPKKAIAALTPQLSLCCEASSKHEAGSTD